MARLERALGNQIQAEPLRLRLLERGDISAVALPPWALDVKRGECTTLAFVAPAPTQFLLHVHPWPGLPSAYASSAGALQLTRCGRERASLLEVRLEMRSPRAVVHTWAAVGNDAPRPLIETLPERDAGAPAPLGEPGPALPREPPAERFRRFSLLAKEAGAALVETRLLPSQGYVRLSLEPGCHRLLATAPEAGAPYRLLLQSPEQQAPDRYDATDDGDVAHELCTARQRALLVSVEADGAPLDRQLAVARFRLPLGLPNRFGPQAAEQLLEALGGSTAPQRLGALVSATLGAQGRTALPRALLPHTCYVAAVAAIHGQAAALSLGVRAGAASSESTSSEGKVGPRIGFCTGKDGQVDLDVEARGLGVAWLFALFHVGPARVEEP